MDKGTKSLLNVVLSVLAPVLILENCSASGPHFWNLGTVWAMVVALSLPIACGVYSLITTHKLDSLTAFGLLGTILTGVVTIYATNGEGEALRPDMPWWYAAKELLIPLLLGGAVLVTAKRQDSMLRAFVYSDSIFDIRAIEKAVDEQGKQAAYAKVLGQANHMLAASLILSGVANFALSLYFLMPVLDSPAAEQAELYNYAVGKMTWWGYLVVGVPLMTTLITVIRRLGSKLRELTGLGDRIMMN